MPEQGPATDRLVRDLFGLHCVVRRGASGTEYRLFALPHGEWIRLMARYGLVVEDLIEVQAPPGAANHDFPEYPDEWVRRWPAEEGLVRPPPLNRLLTESPRTTQTPYRNHASAGRPALNHH